MLFRHYMRPQLFHTGGAEPFDAGDHCTHAQSEVKALVTRRTVSHGGGGVVLPEWNRDRISLELVE
jgi:hypothetical protein